MNSQAGNWTYLYVLVFFCGLFVTLKIYGIDDDQSFSAPEGFRFRIPDGWKQIPKERLAESSQDAKRAMPNMPTPVAAYGFQPATETNSVGYPRILVGLKKVEGITKGDLKALGANLTSLQKKLNQKFEGNSFNGTATLESAEYDEDHELLRVVSVVRLPNDVTLRSIDASFLRPNCLVSFVFCSKDGQDRQDAKFFEEVLTTVRFDNLAPSATRAESQANQDLEERIIRIIGILVVVLAIGIYKGAKRNTTKSQ